jgi:hypothetical protein
VRRKCRARWDADHLEQEVGEGRVRISRETKTIVDDLVPALAEQLDSYNLQVESGSIRAHNAPSANEACGQRVGSVWAQRCACAPDVSRHGAACATGTNAAGLGTLGHAAPGLMLRANARPTPALLHLHIPLLLHPSHAMPVRLAYPSRHLELDGLALEGLQAQ